MKEIKKCPFCGSKAVVDKITFQMCAPVYVVTCVECESSGASGNNEDEAIKNWNRRTSGE